MLAGAAGGSEIGIFRRVGVQDRDPARRHDLGEQAPLGREIGLRRRVIVQMIAREIGEGGGRDPDAIEAELVEPVGGGLHGQALDAGPGDIRQVAMQRHRIQRGQREIFAPLRPHQPQGAETCCRIAKPYPELAGEFDGRGLAAGAGDGDDMARLAGKELRRHQRQSPARVVIRHQECTCGHLGVRFGQHGDGPLGDRLIDVATAVGLRARQRREQESWSDLPRIG